MSSTAEAALAAEAARKDEKPLVSAARATEIAHALYGLDVDAASVRELDSYDDRNFYLRATHSRPNFLDSADANAAESDGADGLRTCHYVLKIHNGVESLDPAFVECQNLAMVAVRASPVAGVWCPRALPALDGSSIARAKSRIASGVERDHAIRCLPYRPGELFANVTICHALLQQLGVVTARMSVALSGFDHPAAHRQNFIWDLANVAQVRPLLSYSPGERHALLGEVLDEVERSVLPRASELRTAVIHGDVNDQNILVDDRGEAVLGIIDFGDMAHSWLINEIAITAAYVVIALHYDRKPDHVPKNADGSLMSEVDAIMAVTGSYAAEMKNHALPLQPLEWAVLPTLIAARITASLTIGAYSSAQDPTNEYLKLTLLPGWHALQRLRATPAAALAERMSAAFA